MNGAEYIIEFLRSKGVKTSFGYPGGQVLALYDAIYQYDFPHVLTRHEQGAVHAAEGYAGVTGQAGVVIATSGPGATNLVTGIADAYLDSRPLFVITGQVAADSIGKDAFQEADTTGITTPITKNNYLVKEISELPAVLEEAWLLVTDGRPGPVLVDIAKNVFSAQLPEQFNQKPLVSPVALKPVPDEVPEACIRALRKAKRPLLLAGGGANRTEEGVRLLRELAERLQLPAVNTLMGKGAWDAEAPYYLGMVGMHGTAYANVAMQECDLLITLGSRYSDRVVGKPMEIGRNRTVIQVDIDNAELDKTFAADILIQADTDAFLKKLLETLSRKKKMPDYSLWLSECIRRKQQHPLIYRKDGALKPQEVIEAVAAQLSCEPVVVTDVGQHQMFAAQYFPVSKPQTFITSGGLGTMGFGLPAAIGAAIGTGKTVCLFAGDGGFQMTMQELAVVANHKLNLKIFVLDNGCLGMVRQWQEIFYEKHYSHSILEQNPDFVTLAKAYGIKGIRLDKREQLSGLSSLLSTHEPVLVHCVVDGEENVYPMIPPGGRVGEMIGCQLENRA